MRTVLLTPVLATLVFSSASFAANDKWKAEFTQRACESGDVYRKRGVDPNVSRMRVLAEEAREALAAGAVPIPKNFPGLFFQDPTRTYYAQPEAIGKLLGGAMRASRRGLGVLLTSAFRTLRGAIDVACAYTDAAGDPDNSDNHHRQGRAFDLFLTDRDGKPFWSRNGRPLMEAQMSAPAWCVATLADIMFGDRSDEESLYRLASEIWHFEDVPGVCTNNICLLHPGSPGCTCKAEGS